MSRNGGCDRYRATLADENAWARARRPNIVNWRTVRATTGSSGEAQIGLVARADSRLLKRNAS